MAQSTEDAKAFYTSKVDELGTNLTDLEKILQGKTGNLRVIEEGTGFTVDEVR